MFALSTAWLGCGGSSPGQPSKTESADTDAELVVDEHGYAVHGDDLYPPLLRRVDAVPCPEHEGAACTADADCGAGQACVCGWFSTNSCLPAECHTDADCPSGPCFLSIGGDDLSACPQGLYCSREDSTCHSGGDCPGNGTACVYVAATDRFACSLPTCAQ